MHLQETVMMTKPRRPAIRRSRRFDMLRKPGPTPRAPWNSPKHNPFMGEWNPLGGISNERLPTEAPALDIPLDYFQREGSVPLMSRRVNGQTVSYPVSSKHNKHAPQGLFSFTKKSKPYSETVNAAVGALIDSRE
jgi:hypothetical protein